jgi:hypothetical protein
MLQFTELEKKAALGVGTCAITHVFSHSDPLEKSVFHWKGILKNCKHQVSHEKYHNPVSL